jgi:thioester reductase-like protein
MISPQESTQVPVSDVVRLSGYSTTKWVSEQLVKQAATLGLPTTIHRPSSVIGHSKSGACNVDDIIYAFIRSVIMTGFAPDMPFKRDMVPVDYVTIGIGTCRF